MEKWRLGALSFISSYVSIWSLSPWTLTLFFNRSLSTYSRLFCLWFWASSGNIPVALSILLGREDIESRTDYSKTLNYPVHTLDPGQAEICVGSGYLAELHGGGNVEWGLHQHIALNKTGTLWHLTVLNDCTCLVCRTNNFQFTAQAEENWMSLDGRGQILGRTRTTFLRVINWLSCGLEKN